MAGNTRALTRSHLSEQNLNWAANRPTRLHPRDGRSIDPKLVRQLPLAEPKALAQLLDVDRIAHESDLVRFAPVKVKRETHRAGVQSAPMSDETSPTARGDRLRQARLAAGFETYPQVKERFGWSTETTRQHENGTRGIERSVAKYAAAYRVSVTWLLYATGPGPGDLKGLEAEKLAGIYRELESDEDRATLMAVAQSMKRNSS